jgi:hypothetical protein
MQIHEILAQTNTDYRPLQDLLSQNGLSVRPKPQLSDLLPGNPGRHIRVDNPIEKIQNVAVKLGAQVQVFPPDAHKLSGKYSAALITFPKTLHNKFPELAGKEFNVVSSLKPGSQVAVKQFIPSKLGLTDKVYSRAELYQTLVDKLQSESQDLRAQILLQLCEVAVKKRKAVDPALLKQFNVDDIRQLGIDFGEILAPLMAGEDQIKFPSGNEMLADVEINGQLISVKSAGGSGTSMKAILPYLDAFKKNNMKQAIKLNNDDQKVENFFRAFVDTPGKNNDKIVAASGVARTPEHVALEKLIGKKDFTVSDLESYAGSFKKNEYGKFLKTIYPVSIAGGYRIKDKDRPNGLPKDASYYMGDTTKKPKAKQAGKPFWMAKGPGLAGRNILIYILAASFLKDAKRAEKKERYSNYLSNVMKKVKAELHWITINPNGTLKLNRKPISDVRVEFQYHAPSHIPGNNLPGISLKL